MHGFAEQFRLESTSPDKISEMIPFIYTTINNFKITPIYFPKYCHEPTTGYQI
jgi:hypothetical protein